MNNQEKIWRLMEKLNTVILGKENLIMSVVAAFLADGHILLEDIPGVGKTTLATALSKVFALKNNRVQFTPDVLPSDLTGFSIYQKDQDRFVFQEGAVFCDLLLADEINRTSPKTQSALLEVMEEKQVTVDGETRKLPQPFFVIATQNPQGTVGTQLLPPAQMDRFLVSLSMGYPSEADEIILAKQVANGRRTDSLRNLVNKDELLEIQAEVNQIYIHDAIYQYLVKLVRETRQSNEIEIGASPRGVLALVKYARAMAWLKGNQFVQPADVADYFEAAIAHRIVLSPKAQADGLTKKAVLQKIVAQVDKPVLRRI
ncbi:MoxR family ATPase [Enterococcus sp. ALS3]|uniref:MoxR family ATPase n=1 Tax=Enterococcus alishanensis TaxID=1303817 RepID=A0ABS6TCQ8_9ENTE|nr:MoxR family ATPase [Enterococcus alishanensis]MBV7390689.1 MoxR family ATPase [Enterococcus alishanensis]